MIRQKIQQYGRGIQKVFIPIMLLVSKSRIGMARREWEYESK
jgi:hypothetical protein